MGGAGIVHSTQQKHDLRAKTDDHELGNNGHPTRLTVTVGTLGFENVSSRRGFLLYRSTHMSPY